MRQWLRGVLVLSLTGATLLGFAGCSQEEKTREQPPPSVVVANPIRKEVVEWDRYTGRIEAIERIEIRARVSGYLQDISFDEGALVKRGQKLFQIDPRPFEAALNQARARLREAEAGVEQATSQREEASAQKLQIEARAVLAQKRLKRAEQAYKQNSISAEELDIRQSEQLQATADLKAADAAIDAAGSAIQTAKSAVETAQAGVENAELDLGYTTIRAPFDGRVGAYGVTIGNLVVGGQGQTTLLTTLISEDPIHCVFDANEREFLKYSRLALSGERESSRKVLNPIYLKLQDEENYDRRGHMDFVDNVIDPNTGTIRGRAIFRNPDNVLTPGLFARLRLLGSAPYEAVLVPDSAIGSDQSQRFVFVVTEENKVERRNVDVGAVMYQLRVIREGVDENDRIIVRGIQLVQPGMTVETTSDTIELGDESFDPTQIKPFAEPIQRSEKPDLPAGPGDEGKANTNGDVNGKGETQPTEDVEGPLPEPSGT